MEIECLVSLIQLIAWLWPLVLDFPRSEEANHVLDIGVVKPNYNERTVVNQQSGFACCSADDSMNMHSFVVS